MLETVRSCLNNLLISLEKTKMRGFLRRIALSRSKRSFSETFKLRDSSALTLKTAAFTMVYNEAIFLPIWRRYYGNSFGERNLFVVDHGSDDGSTDNLGSVNRICIPRDEFDEEQRAIFVSKFQASLLCYYDVVVFSDPDEILIP